MTLDVLFAVLIVVALCVSGGLFVRRGAGPSYGGISFASFAIIVFILWLFVNHSHTVRL